MDTHLLDCDCTSKCRSKQHASDLLTLVTRGNLSQIQAYFNHCYNSCTITDEFGRNVLHMAASCRKWEVVDWLLTEKKINHQVKDIESGWTALHRSIFYGQITSALHLIHHGASLTSQDKEALTPLDIIRLDRPAYVEFQPTGPTDVYTWGTNANFTLGHSNQQSRKHPDLVEEFAKKSISIKQVVVCKYHSVFLSHNGQVYTCGHGQGGRLGHGNEQTYLTPRSLDTMADIKCTQIAAARDHTVMLAEGGVVYTCGLNSCHQLGQPQLGSKYTTPKPILTKLLKGKVITGIEACRFHTVLYCSDTVFTFGLNAGQLGFPKGEQYIQYPKKVSSLDHKETVISHVAASAAVTVCSTVKGDIYILHGYQCRKIATKQINVIKLVAHGGNLDNDVDKDLLQREKGDELTVLVLTASGKVFCWKRSDKSVLKRCCWNYSRQIFMSDMAISKQHMAFITPHGEAFMACFSKKKTKTSPASSLLARSPSVEAFTLSAEVELLEKEEIEEISLQRLALVNRAVRITSDPSGQNFAVLQSDPKTSLVDVPSVSDSGIGKQLKTFLEETNSLDNIHDVILKVQGHEIPAHKYILASRCEYFRKILSSQKSEGKKYKVDSSSGRSVQVIEVEKTNYEMFQMLVQYIYTEHCEMLNPGYKIKSSKKSGWETVDSGIDFDLDADFEELDICDIDGRESAFEIHKGQKKKTRKENKKSGKRRNKSLNEEDENDKKVISGPVKNLQSLAKKFGVPGLANRLDSAKCSKGVIYGIKKPNKKLRFERNKHRHLCDVSIQTDDGEALQCHKCVLVARLEYFRSMLGSGWFETSTSSSLRLPLSSNILRIMLEYLYTDDAVSLRECTNVELLCNILAVSDQYLMVRLKEICEVTLANSITMRNVAELLDFATVYNARQLKNTCIQFICLNLATLLEMRTLEILSEDILEEVSAGYKEMIPSMCRRIITPYSMSSVPDCFTNEMGQNGTVTMETEDEDQNVQYEVTTPDQSSKKAKWKKKSRKRTISAGKDDSIQSDRTTSLENVVAMETIDLSPRVEEAKELLKGSSAEEMKENDEDLTSVISCNVSIPMDLAESNETIQLHSTVWGVQSPTSPVGQASTDLRSIMEAETSRVKRHSHQKTSLIVTHGKMSQKQRKKLASQRQSVKVDTPETEAGNKESEKDSIPKSPLYAWGAVPKSPSAKSFRELQLEDEKHQLVNARRSASIVQATSPPPTLPQVSSREKMLSWGITSRVRRMSEDEISTSPVSSPQSPSSEILCPWKQSPCPKSPSPHTVRFADIMQAEVKQTETLEKNMKKPFHLIQIEERAIQELLTHYCAADNPTEYISVGRDSSMMATPVWKK